MKLISGAYEALRERCDEQFRDGYFEFYFPYIDGDSRFREIDRFLYESKHTVRYKNSYTGNVVIDLSEWNRRGHFNEYFDAFMYFVKDRMRSVNCIFITDRQCGDELERRLSDFFELQHIPLEGGALPKRTRIGFLEDYDVRG